MLDEFVTGTSGRGRCCAKMVQRFLMSGLFRLSRLVLLALLFEGRSISTNPGLNLNLGFFHPSFKRLLLAHYSLFFRASYYQVVDKKNSTKFSLKAFRSEIRVHTNPRLS